jgi:2,5-diketo-D-gluconate reductase B
MSNVASLGPIPQIGYGTWKRDDDEAYRCVLWALEAGYRHIDTAEGYGNESPVGRAIAASGLPRDEIFLTTKVAPEHLGPGQVIPHARASLDRLGVDRVDLLLVHWPSRGDRFAMEEYLGQFRDAQDQGLTRHIGVSNFNKAQIDRAVAILGDRPIVTNQVEIHVFMQNRPIVEHCQAKGIPLTAYAPVARGGVAGNPVLAEIAAAHGVTPTQLALAFLMAEGHIVIPTSGNRGRIAENLAAKDLTLSPAEIARIRGLDEGRRLVNGANAPEWDV